LDLANYIEQQIVQMEESPARRKIEELRKKGLKFEDDRFPPNSNSLCGEWKALQEWKDVKWAKLSTVLPQARIFKNRPEANHIKQGNLGDCYFLAGLAAICERPDRIYNLFLTQEENEQKYYSMKMLYKGKWMVIDVDEYIPFQGNAPAFSKSIDSSLWVILLEKAWAKLYSSYKRIESGFPQETLHDLTGAPIYNINLANANKEK
jgi:calpain-15